MFICLENFKIKNKKYKQYFLKRLCYIYSNKNICITLELGVLIMKCEICHCNVATIHIQEIINGKKKSLHICPECAAKKSEDNPVLQGINLAEMLYNLSDQINDPEDPAAPILAESVTEGHDTGAKIVCEKCGWTTSNFRKTGRLGCAECYKTFETVLKSALKTMHRGTLHIGKHPEIHENDEANKIMMEIINLQKDLEDYVQREEYEKAAEVRDRINELKHKTNDA